MRVQRSIEIAAPPEKIWPFMVEPENILKWCITFKTFEYTSEKRSSVGTTFYVEEKAGPMPLMKLNFTVTECVENERLAFRKTSGTGVKGYEQGWSVKATRDGSRFTFIEEVELPFGVIGKLIGLVGQRSSYTTVKKMLAILKSLAEAKDSSTTPEEVVGQDKKGESKRGKAPRKQPIPPNKRKGSKGAKPRR